MLKSGLIFLGSVLLLACNHKKADDEEGFSYEEFSERFPASSLPYQVSDTALLKNRDTVTIRSAEFDAFIPDSLKTRLFGKNAKVRYVSQTKIPAGKETSFYVVKALSGNKRASLLLAFDKGQYSAAFPLLIPDSDPGTIQWSTIDKGLGITRSVSRRTTETTVEGR